MANFLVFWMQPSTKIDIVCGDSSYINKEWAFFSWSDYHCKGPMVRTFSLVGSNIGYGINSTTKGQCLDPLSWKI